MLHNQERSRLPVFIPMNDYEVYLINHSANTNLLHYRIQLSQKTCYFSIDTESDRSTYRPSLIRLEFIHQDLSAVILFEEKIIYSWGDAIKELSKFIHYHLFTMNTLNQPKFINLQNDFKIWYSRKNPTTVTNSDLWGLQHAIVDQFQQFLDKTETLNRWSHGLDRPNDYINHNKI
ncbi:unnamed protein product [Rotaria sordida]|uniref:Uncharacterized protein n=1 Tax=Rotaria sordida TaxID=392033 RepID=A0A815KRQ3_9BILA|nr:unnamed protein product [Rotaria sordida]CAF4003170.1 unnamed protein product [Rotaria sordida]